MMKQDKSAKTKGAANKGSDDLKRISEGHLAALKSLGQLRLPMWEAIVADLDGRSSKAFSERAMAVARQMQKALDEFHAGKQSRVGAIKSYQSSLHELRNDFELRSIDALWKHAMLQPSLAVVLQTVYGQSARERPWRIVSDRFQGMSLEVIPGSDVGTVQQGLGDPPVPFGSCSTHPYSSHDDRLWSQAISADNLATSSAANGSFFISVIGDLIGGASARSLVGLDFDIPAGFTNVAVTADIDWMFSGWTFVIGGIAGTGADLDIRVEDSGGNIVAESSQSLFSLISPVIWGNSASGSGNSTISTSLATPDAAARTIRVFAGATAHAECGSGFAAGAQAIPGGTVTKICVQAT